MEATLMGVPALAVSLDGDGVAVTDYRVAASCAIRIARQAIELGLPPDTLLNINVPFLDEAQLRGTCLTRQGKSYNFV